jgi:hypothetical protein
LFASSNQRDREILEQFPELVRETGGILLRNADHHGYSESVHNLQSLKVAWEHLVDLVSRTLGRMSQREARGGGARTIQDRRWGDSEQRDSSMISLVMASFFHVSIVQTKSVVQ